MSDFPAPNDGHLAPVRVLHVDDEPAFADMATTFLEREADRLTVETETDPVAALDRLEVDSFDCVVSDYDMPSMDGLELLEAVREEWPELPFVLFTGKGSEEIASEAISAGVTDYLQKETGTDQYTVLSNRIQNAVSRYRTEDQLTEHLDRMTDAFYALDSEWRFTYLNPRAADVLEHDPEQLLGNSIWDVLPVTEGTALEKRYREAMESQEPVVFEYYYPPVETHFEVRAFPTRTGISVYFRSISDRKERQRELTKTARRLSLALQESRAGIWEWDVDTDELYWSDELVELLHVSRETFEGSIDDLNELLHPDDADRVMAAIERAIETGEPYRVEQRLEAADGEYRWLDVRGQVVDDGSRMVGIGVDVTDRKEQKQRLERQNDRLDAFATAVSHDLRNPLQIATGHLELVREECDSEHLDAIADATERMDALIEDLLALAREGTDIGSVESVDLTSVVEDCWRSVERPEAKLVVDVDRSIRADPNRLRQLVENLLRNSVEHGGEDVTVTVGTVADGFYVEDDGPGIPESERDDVFEAGYSTAEHGTGLGLAIVEEVADAHGWEVRSTTADSGGARFEFTGL